MIRGYVRLGKRKSMREKLAPETMMRLAKVIIEKCRDINIFSLKIMTKVSLRYLIMLLLNELYVKV